MGVERSGEENLDYEKLGRRNKEGQVDEKWNKIVKSSYNRCIRKNIKKIEKNSI